MGQKHFFIVKKAVSRLWVLRRLKKLGLDDGCIFDVYSKEIQSVLEFALPVWNGALTLEDSNNIEQIQKRAFKIILQDQYSNYENSCQYFNTEKLVVRREKFA